MRSSIRSMLRNWIRTLQSGKTARLLCASAVLGGSMVGCATQKATLCDRQYCDDIEGISHYKGTASGIAYPCIDTQTTEVVASSIEPRNLTRRVEDTPREITLADVIQSALTQNKVIESSALGRVGAKGVLTNPTAAASVYDPALQASGVLFGRRSVESALADFDTQFTSRLIFGRSDLASPPNSIAGGGNTATFNSSLSKAFATGGSVSLNHDINYTVDAPLAGSSGRTPNYGGRLGLQVRQPLLAGSGVGYTRIAGPSNPAFGAITGVSQGVVIARINEDVSIADFQVAVRNAIRDIEAAYWDLYEAYRVFDTAVVAHESAYETWNVVHNSKEVGLASFEADFQAEDRLYQTKAQVEVSLSRLYAAESELRRLAGMPMNDGTVLRPADEPVLAEIVPDWSASLTEALTNRVELRRQKWQIKSLQLQLQAARSLVRPRLDVIAGYDINGAGDDLLNQNDSPFRSFYGSMTNQSLNSWNAGVQLDIPIGFRFTRSQVRNLELQLAKANAVLASQEKNIAHDIAISIQDLTSSYAAAQSSRKRLAAAAGRVQVFREQENVGNLTVDLVVRAQESLAEAEVAYYQQVVAYRKALMNLNFSTGRLLDDNGVALAEGPWCAPAYQDAELRAHERTHARDAHCLQTAPAEFVSPGPAGTVNLRQPATNATPDAQNSDADLPAAEQPVELIRDPVSPMSGQESAAGSEGTTPSGGTKPDSGESMSEYGESGGRRRFHLDRTIFNYGIDRPLTAYDQDPPR